MLSLYSLVRVGPGRKPKLLVFSHTGSFLFQVWFSLPLDFSSELNSSEDSRAGREFCRLLEDSEESELSQYSYTTPQQTQTTVNQLSQYSYNSFTKLHASAGELSQYSISAMDTNSTNEVLVMFINEPTREKINNLGSDQVKHKPACTVTEDG